MCSTALERNLQAPCRNCLWDVSPGCLPRYIRRRAAGVSTHPFLHGVRPAQREACGPLFCEQPAVPQLPFASTLEGGAVNFVSVVGRARVRRDRGMPVGLTRRRVYRDEQRRKTARGRGSRSMPRAAGDMPAPAVRLEANMMERAVDILLGILAGLLVGLGTVGSTPPDAPSRSVGLMAAPLVVGGLCGGFVSWRLGRNRPPEWRRR